MAALFAEIEANGLAVLRSGRRINDEVNFGMFFVALPKTDLVINEIDASAAVSDLIGANHLVKAQADFGGTVGHGKANDGGIFFEAAPMALVSKGLSSRDANRGEDAPTADEASLAGRKPNFFNGKQAFIMKDVAMNHEHSSKVESSSPQDSLWAIVSEVLEQERDKTKTPNKPI